MVLNELSAVSPVDGRYRNKIDDLAPYFSEYGLIKYRVEVEIKYFIALCEIPLPQLAGVDSSKFEALHDIYRNFTVEDAQTIKETEKVTNHDVKAVEYFIKDKFDALGLSDYKEFVHFGLTSQDINNTSIPKSLKEAVEDVYMPLLNEVIGTLEGFVEEWRDISMLAKTHGQPASPTRMGKEMMVFVERLKVQKRSLENVVYSAKFGGATGNFNAHHLAYGDIDWPAFGDAFLKNHLGISRSHYTTQIEHYDNLAALFDNMKRINVILIDLSRDIWTYVSMEYFKQKIKAGEIGSSAMPHKVNPIDFENAEGNFGIANAIFEHLSAKLPVSRLQRDLTDSTVLRNVGVPIGHTLISFKSLIKGFGKLILNEDALKQDLEDNWPVVAEAIQTILRRENYPNPYETLKGLTRTNEKIDEQSMKAFIETLDVSEEIKEELRVVTPFNYVGVFE